MELSTLWSNILGLLAYDSTSPMLFSSGTFWALFLLFMPIFAKLKKRRMDMVVYVVAFSLYFYYKSSGIFFLLILATSIFDYLLSLKLASCAKEWQRKLCVALSVVASLSILGYFKYAGLPIEALREQMRPQAERQVKARLALETIAALEGVVASEDEINEEYQRIADAYHLEVAQVKGMLDDASIIADLQVKKAMDIVKESAVIKAE